MYGNMTVAVATPQTSTAQTAAGEGRNHFETKSFSHSHSSSDFTTGQYFLISQLLHKEQ
jgi:hypothetical protein